MEDSNSGFEFFGAIGRDRNYSVISAEGKSNIFRKVYEAEAKNILVIADGAAFGPEIDRLVKLSLQKKTVALFLPESFEWLVLHSGVLKQGNLQEILENPEEFIESRDYFSWERFFTYLLTELTKDHYLRYSKRKLNPAYLNEPIVERILRQIEKIQLT